MFNIIMIEYYIYFLHVLNDILPFETSVEEPEDRVVSELGPASAVSCRLCSVPNSALGSNKHDIFPYFFLKKYILMVFFFYKVLIIITSGRADERWRL